MLAPLFGDEYQLKTIAIHELYSFGNSGKKFKILNPAAIMDIFSSSTVSIKEASTVPNTLSLPFLPSYPHSLDDSYLECQCQGNSLQVLRHIHKLASQAL